MSWILESAKARGGHCVIVYTDGNEKRTVTHDKSTGQNTARWHANIRQEIGADLSDLNKDDNLPAEVDITDQVRTAQVR